MVKIKKKTTAVSLHCGQKNKNILRMLLGDCYKKISSISHIVGSLRKKTPKNSSSNNTTHIIWVTRKTKIRTKDRSLKNVKIHQKTFNFAGILAVTLMIS